VSSSHVPFFQPSPSQADQSRRAITQMTLVAEERLVSQLLESARVSTAEAEAIRRCALALARSVRDKGPAGWADGLVGAFGLSSTEGVALMCLAEALLRVPDDATRDLLIRDRIAEGRWLDHAGADQPLFVNAAAWGLLVAGRVVGDGRREGLDKALHGVIRRLGVPSVRRATEIGMRLLGEHFVLGQTIDAALSRAERRETRGYLHSYDMLGEAATTAADAADYFEAYAGAIEAIGRASRGRGPYAGPGISIKLSALHPRYARAQQERVRAELLPRLAELARLAKGFDIGINIDAEEADRLEISLDLLEALQTDPALSGWDGLGFVVQAYSRRCQSVLSHLVERASAHRRRLMVRLVKGAYWDSEIKRAQIAGLSDYPVFTRKAHTDLSYISGARLLLEAGANVFPQFATHNAQTLATIMELAGPRFAIGDYEFQCLHGMGERLYDEIVGLSGEKRPCRVYAPVGSHETLLAYLVRRLLENGANTSFVNRISDKDVDVKELVRDPVDIVQQEFPVGGRHPALTAPCGILEPDRAVARGLDLADERVLAAIGAALTGDRAKEHAASLTGASGTGTRHRHSVNPANLSERIGMVAEPPADTAAGLVAEMSRNADAWSTLPVGERARCLEHAAELMEAGMEDLMPLVMREAGKTAANAVAEIREAVDFLRYYAVEARRDLAHALPLGVVVAISPWNFPLAIFTGQIAAALAAGNVVVAKPAEETPLIAAAAVHLLHRAGIPRDALVLVPGDGATGAALVGARGVSGVLFTGSTAVARLIQTQLAECGAAEGRPIALIAETGGQNAMLVDSTALAEQVTLDVLNSAFDSAGQRCSALRLLCLQEEIAGPTQAMIEGAMAELSTGDPAHLSTDVGPVISVEARDRITAHIEAMAAKGHRIVQSPLSPQCAEGVFVAPTLIEIDKVSDLEEEVFGPVLHVLRYQRADRDRLIDAINELGYRLTFALHSRIETTIEAVAERIDVGNIYINRNQVGAVVGVQPFGGHGLSGTGPKAGGPLYLRRLVRAGAAAFGDAVDTPLLALTALADWAESEGVVEAATRVRLLATHVLLVSRDLAGPVGEANHYQTRPRGTVLLAVESREAMVLGLGSALASGNMVKLVCPQMPTLPDAVASLMTPDDGAGTADAVLVERGPLVATLLRRAAPWPAVVPVLAIDPAGPPPDPALLLHERTTSRNTAAAGGNAQLMTIGG
jgi:RHH-type proline utilization regulon transcriptional repressor/proline dehydrogenase/delta 1-pyrroline-5-carboxylate dehydrogenase